MKIFRLVVVLFSVITPEVVFALSALRSVDGWCCLDTVDNTLCEACHNCYKKTNNNDYIHSFLNNY